MLVPVPEIVPALALQFTAVFELPVTVAENPWVPPVGIVAVAGEIATETLSGIWGS